MARPLILFLYEILFRYDRLALMLSHTLSKPSEDSLLTDLIRSIQYPILESNLRSVDTNESLPLLKIYRQLLQVNSSGFAVVNVNEL